MDREPRGEYVIEGSFPPEVIVNTLTITYNTYTFTFTGATDHRSALLL